MANLLYDALIAPHAANTAPFLIGDDGRSQSYAEFVRRAAQVANVLAAHDLRPGDRVVAQVPKLPDAVALYAGTVQAGAVYLPLNTGYTQAELAYFIADAAPKVVVCDSKDAETLRPLCPQGAVLLTLGADGGGTLPAAADAAADRFATVPCGPDDLAGLLYTSGTTGRSKGAMMSHRNLLSNAQALTDLWQITAQDRLIHALPIFHTHGLFVALNTSLLAGAQVRFMTAFTPDAVIAELPQSTLMMGVPTFYTRLLADPRLTTELCAGMRLFISGSAPLLAETHDAFAARTGHKILERYGMTETNMITSNPYTGDRVAGTVGFPLPGTEVVITDPATGAPLPQGAIGMIEVRGPNVFSGYWNMPDKTREDLRDTGFFITGDLGVADADGRISIVGRMKDLIIAGGYNIYPKEVEDAINAVAGVLESAVFGVPDADLGEQVVAGVVLEAGVTLTTADIAAQVAATLARFKQPRRYVLLDTLPRNTMGKVQKNVLRRDFSA
ncbi:MULTISPECIES: malonyl-CoA synthase [unclassified Yoonia]|uniref:malonate--CoA ligase n=1 Tax=unclassified Yoonia TaxID=2629118 RepID=UPI002AFE27B9|nr:MULTISPECIES: malonyl-CoA synthase [unclassified Yoonia]